jgi:hypothetical protein
MKYLCLAYGAEGDWRALSRAQQDALLAQDEVLRRARPGDRALIPRDHRAPERDRTRPADRGLGAAPGHPEGP